MRINGMNGADRMGYVSQACPNEKENVSRPERNMDSSSQRDRITLSETGRDVRRFIENADKTSEVDRGKIHRIRQAIESGTYRVSAKELAEVIADEIAGQNRTGEDGE